MKKNLISVVILALVFANFVLTALLMFSVLPETKKANTLIEKVCSAIDLDLNSGAATGTSNVSIDDQEIYKVSTGEDLTTNLAEGKDGKTHYAVLNVSLVLNKKSDNYKKYTQDFLTNQDDTIKNDIIKVVSGYTFEQFNQNSDVIKDTILEDMQNLFGKDYARPSKFSKEHLRTMEMIFEHYGRLLSTNLPVYLRKNVQVEVVNSEAVTYSEFSNALSNPVLLGIVNFAPLKGNIILEMASNLGYAIVDRMLGGRGDPMDKVREFSEIELLIIERIMIVCVNLLREPWENVADIHPRLERIETNSQYAQIISPSEMIAIVTINLKIGEVEGLMNVCLPYLTLEDVIDKLNTKYWYSNLQNQDNTDYTESIETLIRRAQIPIKAVLGNSMISVNDFAMLQPGDIIRLDRKVEDELDIYVGNIRKFTALPGSSGDKYAVRVTSVIREEQ